MSDHCTWTFLPPSNRFDLDWQPLTIPHKEVLQHTPEQKEGVSVAHWMHTGFQFQWTMGQTQGEKIPLSYLSDRFEN